MKNKVLLLLTFPLVGCANQNSISLQKGVYHFVDSSESKSTISMTIRLTTDTTFSLFGVIKSDSNIFNNKPSYSQYITFGNWVQKENYIIFNTNINYINNSNYVLKKEDMPYLEIRPWDFLESVINIKNDSFLILNNGKSIKSVKNDFTLIYQEKQ